MRQNLAFIFYGLSLISGIAYTQYRGWGDFSINEVKNVPRSVRDNPGSYRSHYGIWPRYSTGK